MVNNMNSVQLMGRLIKDVELRFTQGGMAVAEFTIAVDKQLSRDKKAEFEKANKPTADFIRIAVWGKLAESCEKYTAKGKRIIVQGSISTDRYKDKDGKDVNKTFVNANNVQFVDFADSNKNEHKAQVDDFDDFRTVDDESDLIPF
jgi:single-strand DNA-binding protein